MSFQTVVESSMNTLDPYSEGRTRRPSGWPIRRVFDLFSSVWFGIVLMVLLFVYSTLMSAGVVYPTRFEIFTPNCFAYVVPNLHWRHWEPRIWLDLTEMEAFSWWPFNLMVALFCLVLILVTLRRIRPSVVNLGVWMIHSGILILVGGSVYYFSTKVEGDAPVYRRQVEISVPGRRELVRLPVVPNNETTAGGYRFRIKSTDPAWSLLSGPDEGKKVYSVKVEVTSPQRTFERQLLAGYPQYTEDIIPGQGRAIKETGQKLLDDRLEMRLAYLPQDSFFVVDTGALYARPALSGDPAPEWTQHPLHGLPHYHDHVADRSWVKQAGGEPPLPLRPLDLEVDTDDPSNPLHGLDVRVTGYLRYADESPERFKPGGQEIYPVVGVTLRSDAGAVRPIELEAFHRGRSTEEDGLIDFLWADSKAALEQIAAGSAATLHIDVPSREVTLDAPITRLSGSDPDVPFTPIEGTDYAYRVRSVADRLVMDRGRFAGQAISFAMVEIRSPQRTWERWVSDRPEVTRDVSGTHEEIEFDANILMSYTPAARRAPLTVVAGPDEIGLHLFVDTEAPFLGHHLPAVGQRIGVGPGISFELNYFYRRAEPETRPFVTPRHMRRKNARETFSRIRVELRKGPWSHALWLPYNAYVLPDRSYAYPGKIAYLSEVVTLPGGRQVELLFSRQRWPLGTQVALDTFELPVHTGGYTGQAITVRDYVSRVRFKDGRRWSGLQTVRNNHPTEHRGWWYFQSEWDPPHQGRGGMNYTGLGVGNRNGVYIQLAGTVIAVMGMIYAFYVKPIIKRRQRESVWTQVGNQWSVSDGGRVRSPDVGSEVATV